jgi:hypothetical protein
MEITARRKQFMKVVIFLMAKRRLAIQSQLAKLGKIVLE